MARNVDDQAYVECLPNSVYRKHYSIWREKMLQVIDSVAEALKVQTLPQVMTQFRLSPRDVALLVQLKYFSDEEVKQFDLAGYYEVDCI